MKYIASIGPLLLVAGVLAHLPGGARESAAGPLPETAGTADIAARDQVGHELHQQMLAAFSYDRDYAKTLDLARQLSKPSFDGYEYQSRARELAEQLPLRSTDFREFRLPAPEEWAKQKTTLSRKEQIDFLAPRLRLLNCFQWGQPGGVSFAQPQFEEPSHLTNPRDMKGNVSRVLINPYGELKELNLAVADIPDLLRWVEDRNFTLTFSFWRDFAPHRDLYRVGDLIAAVINDIAKRKLVDADRLATLQGDARNPYLAEVRRWAASHGEADPAELRVERLRDATSQQEFMQAMGAVRMAKDREAGPVLVARAEDFPDLRQYVAEALYAVASADGLELARKWSRESIERRPDDRGGMQHAASKGLRFWSSLIVLQHGDRASIEGLDTLAELLRHDPGLYWTGQAIDVLVPMGDGPPRKALCASALQPVRFFGGDIDKTLRRLLDLGCREVIEGMTAALEDPSETSSFYSPPEDPKRSVKLTRADFATTIVRGWRDGAPKFPPPRTIPSTPEEREELIRWLGARR